MSNAGHWGAPGCRRLELPNRSNRPFSGSIGNHSLSLEF